ncbi:hypothetical protein C8R45DRAFT_942512 [Mycena sanguinolenta]|nr:hypothetical protein C8R45DRAFT_942512 [Mycena sanguinolenta]
MELGARHAMRADLASKRAVLPQCRQHCDSNTSQHGYLRHSWSRIDIITILSFWASFAIASAGVEHGVHNIRIFCTLSTLRTVCLLTITSSTTAILHLLRTAQPLLASVTYLVVFVMVLLACSRSRAAAHVRLECNRGEPETVLSNQFCGGFLDPVHFNKTGSSSLHWQMWSPLMYIIIDSEYFITSVLQLDQPKGLRQCLRARRTLEAEGEKEKENDRKETTQKGIDDNHNDNNATTNENNGDDDDPCLRGGEDEGDGEVLEVSFAPFSPPSGGSQSGLSTTTSPGVSYDSSSSGNINAAAYSVNGDAASVNMTTNMYANNDNNKSEGGSEYGMGCRQGREGQQKPNGGDLHSGVASGAQVHLARARTASEFVEPGDAQGLVRASHSLRAVQRGREEGAHPARKEVDLWTTKILKTMLQCSYTRKCFFGDDFDFCLFLRKHGPQVAG